MTKAERARRAHRREVRQRAQDAAYARGDCVECFQPHNNINTRTRLPTRVCARCQERRTTRQRERREEQREEERFLVSLAVAVVGAAKARRTVLGQ
jgi:NMD protein affecting ribosome stability and mRNA decay